MYLAQKGHRVMVLAEEERLASDANPVHFVDSLRHAWEALDNFSYITKVKATRIAEGKVFYRSAAGGAEMSVQGDSVVIDAGRRPRHREALKFFGSADRFFTIGDCNAQGDVQTSIRNAFAAASQV
jgi:hypothetical protein